MTSAAAAAPRRSRPGRLPSIPWMLCVALGLLGACRTEPSPPPGDRRVVILGVDGAGWEHLSPLLEEGRLPHLARLYRAGAAGQVVSMEPTLPAPVYTSLATGLPPSAHHILGETQRRPDGYGLRPVTADLRDAPPVWSIASSRGLTVGVAGWPATFPVDRVDGFMISDLFEPGRAAGPGFIHPPDALGQGQDPAAGFELPDSIEEVAALDPGLRRRFEEDLRMMERGLALYRVYQPRLALFRLQAVDYASHRFWPYDQTAYLDLARSRGLAIDPERAAALGRAVAGAYLFLDECVGRLLDRIPIDATLLIVSPFSLRGVGLTDYLHVDVDGLLERLGYLSRNGDGSIDWPSTVAFSLPDGTGAPRGIYLNVRGREAMGVVEPGRVEETARQVAAELSALRTSADEPLFLRAAASSSGGDAPDISIVENLGLDPMAPIRVGEFRGITRDLFHRVSNDFAIHRPRGILLAAGEGIRSGVTGLEAGLGDIVPTVLSLLGLPPSDALPGRPIEGLLAGGPGADGPEPVSYESVDPSPEPVYLPEGISTAWLEKLGESGHFPSLRGGE